MSTLIKKSVGWKCVGPDLWNVRTVTLEIYYKLERKLVVIRVIESIRGISEEIFIDAERTDIKIIFIENLITPAINSIVLPYNFTTLPSLLPSTLTS